MSSNRFLFVGTVKFKIAMWYATLFALSATIAFAILYFLLSRNMLHENDALLASTTSEIEFEYLTGNKFRRFDREIPIAEIPRHTIEAFEQKIPGFKAAFAFERDAYGKQLRTVVGYADKKLFEVRQNTDGSVYSKQLKTADHIAAVQRTFNLKAFGAGSDSVFLRLFDSEGKLVIHSEPSDELKLPDQPIAGDPYHSVIISGKSFRVSCKPMFDGKLLEIGTTLEPMRQRLEQYSKIFTFSAFIVLVLGGFCGWVIARKFMAGVERVSEAALDIAKGDFSRRVQHGGEGVEIDRLVDTFNRMNANTEKLMGELRMVTDNIAHDLRTPLTRMRGMVEVTFEGPQDLLSYQDMAAAVADECANMLQMLNTMLEITRTESRPDELNRNELNLNEVLIQGHDLLSPLAEVKEIDFKLGLSTETVILHADKFKIQRMISNLLENAVKFTPEHGVIELSMALDDSNNAVIKISDSGCGISEEDQKHIFERFFRSDQSRTLPGNGLGLSLVQAIVLAHNGHLSVESILGQGTTFTVILPLDG